MPQSHRFVIHTSRVLRLMCHLIREDCLFLMFFVTKPGRGASDNIVKRAQPKPSFIKYKKRGGGGSSSNDRRERSVT